MSTSCMNDMAIKNTRTEIQKFALLIGLQWYTDASVNHDIFSNDMNIDI